MKTTLTDEEFWAVLKQHPEIVPEIMRILKSPPEESVRLSRQFVLHLASEQQKIRLR